jgi:hypothetical protein
MRNYLTGLGFLGVFGLGLPVAWGAAFNFNQLAVTPGTGDKALAAFYPQLVGRTKGTDLEQVLNTNLAQNAGTFAANINGRIDNLDLAGFLRRSASATSLAGAQVAVDDASHFEVASLGLGVSVAGASVANLFTLSNLGDTLSNGHPSRIPGVGVAPAITLGINLGRFAVPTYRYFDFRRLSVFAHGFGYTYANDTFRAKYYSWGLAGRYSLLRPVVFAPHGLLRWGGLNVGAGFNLTSVSASADYALAKQTQTAQVAFQNKTLDVDLVWDSVVGLRARLGAMSIPLEATSSFQLGYLLTFYGGGALDFSFGSSSVTANTKAPITLTLRDPATGKTVPAGAPLAVLDLNVNEPPVVVDVRGMVGLQVNLGVMGLFAQGQANSAGVQGVNAGLRGFW